MATRNRGILYPIFNRCSPIPTRTKINILKMYVNPIPTYAGAAWALFLTESQWKRIESVQTIRVRTILGTQTSVSNHITLYTAGLLKIQDTIRPQAAALFHKNRSSRFYHIRTLGRIPHQNLTLTKHQQKPRFMPVGNF